MPRPPVLPTIDWNDIYSRAMTYDEWLDRGESRDDCDAVDSARAGMNLSPQAGEFLSNITRDIHIFAIAEEWCPDVIRHVPVVQHMVSLSPRLDIRYAWREDFPDVFVRFLTNGGEAIPKFVIFSADFVECGNWGPMPYRCRELIARGKACSNVAAARKAVAVMYAEDKEMRIVVDEFVQLFDIAQTATL